MRRYTAEELDEFEENGELYVCQTCDCHGHVDDFGEVCPKCGEELDDTPSPCSSGNANHANHAVQKSCKKEAGSE